MNPYKIQYPHGWLHVWPWTGDHVNVMPDCDLREHRTDLTCWCKPYFDEEDQLVIHNSADGREDFETGRRQMS
jgi:hypothetical protein